MNKITLELPPVALNGSDAEKIEALRAYLTRTIEMLNIALEVLQEG